jgi:hypothetical protein
MGNGAMKESKGSKVTGFSDELEELFMETAYVACKGADKRGLGVLERSDFFSTLHSKNINFNLSPEDREEFLKLAAVRKDGLISYTDIIPTIRMILKRIYQRKGEDWNDWCLVNNRFCFCLTSQMKTKKGSSLFLNKRSGTLQITTPQNFHEARVEEQKFEYFRLQDGTDICTHVNEQGQRLYMDWESQVRLRCDMRAIDSETFCSFLSNFISLQALLSLRADSQEWRPIPQEWYQESAAKGDTVEEGDPRMGYYSHPKLGQVPTYFFENARNTRLYFDEEQAQWARMPLAWERNILEVKDQLRSLDAAFPLWRNVNEQVHCCQGD